jgi:hypothetical protein
VGRSEAQSYEFGVDVSEHLFKLATESLRLYSNQTGEFQTLGKLVDARSAGAASLDSHDASTLQEHLAVIPTAGAVKVELDISNRSLDYLEATRAELSIRLGAKLTFGDALSLLLFDYVVDRKSQRLLDLLEIDHRAPRQPTDNFMGSRH